MNTRSQGWTSANTACAKLGARNGPPVIAGSSSAMEIGMASGFDTVQAPVAGDKDTVDAVMHLIVTGIEIAGVGIIVISTIVAAFLFLRQGWRNQDWNRAYEGLRANLARGILLGLEFLVAADIIGTVALTPTFESLGVLAGIVLIRTFLSFSLEVEIEGRWPWQRKSSGE